MPRQCGAAAKMGHGQLCDDDDDDDDEDDSDSAFSRRYQL